MTWHQANKRRKKRHQRSCYYMSWARIPDFNVFVQVMNSADMTWHDITFKDGVTTYTPFRLEWVAL